MSFPRTLDEEGVDPARMTETFAEVVVAVDTWRWSGVPFRLRSGKAIGSPRQEVTITFKDPPLLPSGFTGFERPDRLRIGIAPGAGQLCLEISVNGPGDPLQIDRTDLTAAFGAGELPEYGEVLKGVLDRRSEPVGARRHGRGVLADRRAGPRGLGPRRGADAAVRGRERRSRRSALITAVAVERPRVTFQRLW